MKVKDWADPRRRHLKEKGWVRCDRATGPNQSKELWCDPITGNFVSFRCAFKRQLLREEPNSAITCQADIVDAETFYFRKCSRKPKANGYCHQHRRLA